MNTSTTKDAGSNMTAIVEYTETAAGLADLRQRHAGVVYNVTVPKEMKAAKEARAELRTLRTDLEKKRVEIKAPALERCRLIDAEAKRLTEEIRALEEPIDVQIKAEEARKQAEELARLEAERLRVEGIAKAIEEIRNVPGSLIGKPAVIVEGQLAKLRTQALDPEFYAERFREAEDALAATIARIEQQLQAQKEHEAEQKRIQQERAELERMRAENDRLQREAEQRRLADERRAAEERFESERKERERVGAIVARIDGIPCMARNLDGLTASELAEIRRTLQTMHPDTSGADFAEFKSQAVEAWDVAEAELSAVLERRQQQEAAARAAAEQRAREEAELAAERERQAAEQRRLEAERAELERQRIAAAKKAEAERLASIGLREAAVDVMDWAEANGHASGAPFRGLRAALSNDAAENLSKPDKPARGKRRAAT